MEAEPAEEATNQQTIKIPCFIQKKSTGISKLNVSVFIVIENTDAILGGVLQ